MILFVSDMMRSSLAGLKHDPHKVAIMDSNSISATTTVSMSNGIDLTYYDISKLKEYQVKKIIKEYYSNLNDPLYDLKQLIAQAEETWKDGREA